MWTRREVHHLSDLIVFSPSWLSLLGRESKTCESARVLSPRHVQISPQNGSLASPATSEEADLPNRPIELLCFPPFIRGLQTSPKQAPNVILGLQLPVVLGHHQSQASIVRSPEALRPIR